MINILSGINATSSALNAERTRIEVISQNIANANTTHDVDGQPYQRQHVVFENVLSQHQGLDGSNVGDSTVQIARIERDQAAPRLVYEPGHPDADKNGMVAMPNINVHEEMADLIVASRAFEANLAVVRNARTLALQTLNIGKR